MLVYKTYVDAWFVLEWAVNFELLIVVESLSLSEFQHSLCTERQNKFPAAVSADFLIVECDVQCVYCREDSDEWCHPSSRWYPFRIEQRKGLHFSERVLRFLLRTMNESCIALGSMGIALHSSVHSALLTLLPFPCILHLFAFASDN